jgi:hypothetical protein
MVTPELVAAIRPEWEAARADAGFAETDARLYPFAGIQSADGDHPYYFVPGHDLVQSEKFPDELGGRLQDANEHRDSHRIAISVGAPTVALGAKLRHELEHARQFDAHGKPLFNLNDLALATLSERVGGLPGGGVLYNLNPMEIDANAGPRSGAAAVACTARRCIKGSAMGDPSWEHGELGARHQLGEPRPVHRHAAVSMSLLPINAALTDGQRAEELAALPDRKRDVDAPDRNRVRDLHGDSVCGHMRLTPSL